MTNHEHQNDSDERLVSLDIGFALRGGCRSRRLPDFQGKLGWGGDGLVVVPAGELAGIVPDLDGVNHLGGIVELG